MMADWFPFVQARGDYADMHAAVQHLPMDLPLEDLIWASHRAFKQHPPAVVVQMAALSTEVKRIPGDLFTLFKLMVELMKTGPLFLNSLMQYLHRVVSAAQTLNSRPPAPTTSGHSMS